MTKVVNDKTPTAEEEAYKVILKKYRKLYRFAKPTIGDDPKLRKAFRLALEISEGIQYGAKDAYGLPRLEVARIVAEELGLRGITIICALLYDSGEYIEPSELRKVFGVTVAKTIKKLLKLEALITRLQASGRTPIRDLLIAITDDPRVFLIQLAAHLQKMRMMASLPHAKQARTASDAKHVYIPLAHRLGFYPIKSALEDLYLRCSNEKAYYAITEQIKHISITRKQLFRSFTRPIREVLKKKGFSFAIKTRHKSVFSIWNKMQALGIPFGKVYDIFAIRIILDALPSQEKLICWQIDEVVTYLYRAHPSRFRNWLSYPRPNGYQSLHTTLLSHEGVWVEVQIRTQRMDELAEQGRAAHWQYKATRKKGKLTGLDLWLSQVRTVLEQEAQDADALLEQMDAIL